MNREQIIALSKKVADTINQRKECYLVPTEWVFKLMAASVDFIILSCRRQFGDKITKEVLAVIFVEVKKVRTILAKTDFMLTDSTIDAFSYLDILHQFVDEGSEAEEKSTLNLIDVIDYKLMPTRNLILAAKPHKRIEMVKELIAEIEEKTHELKCRDVIDNLDK